MALSSVSSPANRTYRGTELRRRWLHLAVKGKQIRYAIVLGSEVIGTIGLYSVYAHQKRANIGYDLLSRYWGKGFMSEALAAFSGHCFERWSFNRLQALVLPQHEVSRRLLEKNGFVCEGLLRQYEQWPSRGAVDLLMYALLSDEYQMPDDASLREK